MLLISNHGHASHSRQFRNLPLVSGFADVGNKKIELADSSVVVRYLADVNHEPHENPDPIDDDFS